MIDNIPQLPEMVITKAENHPIWINGTVLVNGMPIITDNHKDETRLNEFIAAGFSPQYIQWLTVNDHRYRVENHSPCPKRSYHPKSVSYAGIKAETQVSARGDDPIIAVIRGTSVSLVCAGVSYCVCSAPAGKSKTFQDKFCRAVVRSFLDDPANVWDYVPLYAVPEKAPAEPISVDIPDYVGAYTQEAITGYPEDRYFVDLELSPAERADIMEMVRWDPFDDVHDNGYTRNQYDALDQSVQHETDRDIIAAFEPVKPAGWVPYLKLSIREFPIPGCSRAMTGLHDDTWIRDFVLDAV